jgi:hypothetical protein
MHVTVGVVAPRGLVEFGEPRVPRAASGAPANEPNGRARPDRASAR